MKDLKKGKVPFWKERHRLKNETKKWKNYKQKGRKEERKNKRKEERKKERKKVKERKKDRTKEKKKKLS